MLPHVPGSPGCLQQTLLIDDGGCRHAPRNIAGKGPEHRTWGGGAGLFPTADQALAAHVGQTPLGLLWATTGTRTAAMVYPQPHSASLRDADGGSGGQSRLSRNLLCGAITLMQLALPFAAGSSGMGTGIETCPIAPPLLPLPASCEDVRLFGRTAPGNGEQP